ncbi:hypothetical protein, partial [Pseudomonas aeruginosa]
DCILNFYRHTSTAIPHGLEWLNALIEFPVLRGALPAETLRDLCDVLRREKMAMTEQNVSKLLAIVRALPVGSSY